MSFAWSEETIARVVSLFRANTSIRTIAQEVGTTPGTISGKLGRLRVYRHIPDAMLKQRNIQQAKRQRKQRPPVPPATPKQKFEPPRYDLPAARIEDVARKALIDLDRHECKWPVGDPRDHDFGFCALPTAEGQKYCETHRRRSIRDDTDVQHR